MNNEIVEITTKIEALDAIRAKLERDLLKLQEEELELDDECGCLLALLIQLASHSSLQWRGFGSAWSSRVPQTNPKRVRVIICLQALEEGEVLRSYLQSITSCLLVSHSWYALRAI